MSEQKPVAIVMITRNGAKYIKWAIDSIIRRTGYPYKLIIINGGSTDNTKELIEACQKNYPNYIEVHNIENIGAMKAINKGLLELSGDMDVYLTHDDCILPNLYGRDWLTELVKLSKLPNCGAVTTIGGGGISGPEYLKGFEWLGTWSLYLKREVIEKIGGLDLAYEPGNGDDIDYTYAILQAGFTIYRANFWIDHHRMSAHVNDASMGDKIEKIKRRNEKYFRKKWKLEQ